MGMAKRSKASRTTADGRKRVAGYIRVSTLEQTESGLGLQAQEEQIRAWATLCGFEVGAMFCDAGESGAKSPSARFGLSEALAKVRSGELAGIVVAKLDRLSRSCRDVAELVLDAESHGWDLLSVSEKLDTSTPSGKLQVRILASFAEFERDMISQRTTEGLAQVAKQGRLRSGRVPFGWELVVEGDGVQLFVNQPVRGAKQSLRENPNEAEILKTMVRMRSQGLGAMRVANRLNKRGIENPRTEGPWTTGTVAAILKTYNRRAKLGVATPTKAKAEVMEGESL